MRDFAKISCSIWGSRKFRSLPDDDARLVYFYLHTNPHVNSLGCYVLRPGYALADLGWDTRDDGLIAYRKAIECLCNSGLIGYDHTESVVRIVDFLKHSPFTNVKHAKGAIKIAYQIPYCAEKNRLISELRGMRHVPDDILPAGDDSLSIAYQKPIDTPRPETQTETETETYKNGGGGSAQARGETAPSQPDPQAPQIDGGGQTFREQMLDAMGAPSSGIVNARPTALGGRVDMMIADKWMNDLGLSEATILTVIREIAADKRDGPPSSFKYFTPAMQREAARLAQAPLMPANANEARHDRQTAHDRRKAAASERLGRILDAAARTD